MISFRASEDGQYLVVRKLIEEHNHVISKVRHLVYMTSAIRSHSSLSYSNCLEDYLDKED